MPEKYFCGLVPQSSEKYDGLRMGLRVKPAMTRQYAKLLLSRISIEIINKGLQCISKNFVILYFLIKLHLNENKEHTR